MHHPLATPIVHRKPSADLCTHNTKLFLHPLTLSNSIATTVVHHSYAPTLCKPPLQPHPVPQDSLQQHPISIQHHSFTNYYSFSKHIASPFNTTPEHTTNLHSLCFNFTMCYHKDMLPPLSNLLCQSPCPTGNPHSFSILIPA